MFKGKVIITGDFNAHNPLWKSKFLDGRGKCIEDLLDEYNFTLINTGEPTYHRSDGFSSVLDLTFVSNGLAHKSSWKVLSDTLGSDHSPTCTAIGEHIARESEDILRWNLRKADWSKYREVLRNRINDLELSDDIDHNAESITQAISLAADRAIPKSKPSIRRPKRYLTGTLNAIKPHQREIKPEIALKMIVQRKLQITSDLRE